MFSSLAHGLCCLLSHSLHSRYEVSEDESSQKFPDICRFSSLCYIETFKFHEVLFSTVRLVSCATGVGICVGFTLHVDSHCFQHHLPMTFFSPEFYFFFVLKRKTKSVYSCMTLCLGPIFCFLDLCLFLYQHHAVLTTVALLNHPSISRVKPT